MIKHMFIFGVIIPTIVTVLLFISFLVCWFKFNLHGKLFKKSKTMQDSKKTTTPNGVIVETTEITQAVEYQGGNYENVQTTDCPQCCCSQCCPQQYCCQMSTDQYEKPRNGGNVMAQEDIGYYSCTSKLSGHEEHSSDGNTECAVSDEYGLTDDNTVNVCQRITLCNNEYTSNNEIKQARHPSKNCCHYMHNNHLNLNKHITNCYTNENLCLSPTDPENQHLSNENGRPQKHKQISQSEAGTLKIRGGLECYAETFVQQTFHFPVDSDAGSEDGNPTHPHSGADKTDCNINDGIKPGYYEQYNQASNHDNRINNTNET